MAIQLISTATVVSSSDVSSLTVSKPSGVQAEDMLIAVMSQDDHTGTIYYPPPSGFTQLAQVDNDYNNIVAFYKKATASEPANYTFSSSNTDGTVLALFVIRDSSGGKLRVDSYGTGTTSAPSLTTPAGGNFMRFAIFGYHAGGLPSQTIPGMTSIYTLNAGAVSSFGAYSTTDTSAKTTSNYTPDTAISLVIVGEGASPLKYYDGTQFKRIKRAAVWDGTQWKTAVPKQYNGSEWR